MAVPHTVRLVPYDRTYLDQSWSWLSDPEIRRMTMTPEFTLDDQQRFFDLLPDRHDYKIWGIEVDGCPVGAAGIKHISEQSGEVWLYIGERAFWGTGIGGTVLGLCEEKAIHLGLRRLRMVALASNQRSVRAFEKAGFVPGLEQNGDGTVRLSKTIGR